MDGANPDDMDKLLSGIPPTPSKMKIAYRIASGLKVSSRSGSDLIDLSCLDFQSDDPVGPMPNVGMIQSPSEPVLLVDEKTHRVALGNAAFGVIAGSGLTLIPVWAIHRRGKNYGS